MIATKHLLIFITFIFTWTLPACCQGIGAGRQLDAGSSHRMQMAISMRDLFQVVDFVKLETNQDSLISGIKKAIHLEGFWYILDQDDVVFQFDKEGRFIRMVGGIGQGPGEYLIANDIQRIFDNRLAVHDDRAGALMIYSATGDFIKKIDLRHWFKDRFPSIILWDRPEQVVLVGCHGLSRHQPIDESGIYQIENDFAKLLTSFNVNSNEVTRHFSNIQAKLNWTCAARVGENIWIGSPYNAKICMYDRDGKLIKTLGRKHPDQIQESEVLKLDIHKRSDSRILFKAARNLKIQPIGQLVVAPINSNRRFKTDIFSHEGELLASALDSSVFQILLGGSDDFLIYDLAPLEEASHYKTFFNETEFSLLTSRGFDPDAAMGQNPWLIIAKPIQ